MPRYRLAADADADWAPIERLCRLCCERPELPPLDPGEFMYMIRLVAPRRPPIHLYKHIDTRRYLNLDDAGHAFRVRWYLGTSGSDTVIATCRPHRDLLSALVALDLPERRPEQPSAGRGLVGRGRRQAPPGPRRDPR